MKDQFFADYLERLEGLQHRLHQAVRDLPAEAVDWAPGAKMNTVAVLLAHITGVLHEGIDLALDNPPSRVRAQEFQTHGLLGADLLRRLDTVIDYGRGALPRLGLADLAQARQDEDGPVTCGWVLLHALEHAYLHLGHLQLTCQLWRQREEERAMKEAPIYLGKNLQRKIIMNLQARPYRDPADLIPMRQLVMTGRQAKIPASYMHPGCLDWDTHYPPDEEANQRNLRLWECVDREPPTLEAWAIFSRREGSFDLFVSPAIYDTPLHERVMGEYVAWAERRAHEAGLKKLWPFWAMEHDQVLARLHQAYGYVAVQADPPVPLFERAFDDLPTIRLPDGFTVQGVSNLADGKLRAAVLHSHFRPNGDWNTFWAEYAQFMGTTVYDGERDLFVRSPDGRGASACTIWFDLVNGVGLFEPVSTHPDFQGKGLGKAVMSEGLRRMKAAGMTRAIVGFDPTNVAALALYTSMGFAASAYFTFPQKELS